MTTKSIKISEENHSWLVRMAGELQKETGESVSVDKALSRMRPKKISDLAGSWEMSKEEVKKIKKEIKKGWSWQIRSL